MRLSGAGILLAVLNVPLAIAGTCEGAGITETR